MESKALYVEIDAKVYNKTSKMAERLGISKAKLVELSLRYTIKNDPQLELFKCLKKKK